MFIAIKTSMRKIFYTILLFSVSFIVHAQDIAAEVNKKDSLKIFEKVEVEAAFPGGLQAWRRFLETNLNPQVPADKGAPVGTYTVVVRFIVDKDGSLSDFEATTKHGYGMEAEILRVLKLSPKWTPASDKGRNVKAYRSQPVTFMISEEGKRKRRRS
jgi:periplasmic protein TonB